MTLFDTILDSAEIALSCAYASWLHKHKHLEPGWTFVEVTIGVAYTLAFAHARGAWHGGDWREQSIRTLREFCISAPPIVIGELMEKLEERRELRDEQERPI